MCVSVKVNVSVNEWDGPSIQYTILGPTTCNKTSLCCEGVDIGRGMISMAFF